MATDNTADSAANEGGEKRGRGPRGPRETFFACFAKSGKEVIQASIKADTEEKAKKAFERDKEVNPNGLPAQAILGPFYEVKGSGQSKAAQVFVKLKDVTSMAYTMEQYTGTFGGWHVLATAIQATEGADGQKYKDKELVHLLFTDKPVDANDKQPKPRINPALIPLSSLENAKLRKPA